MLWRINRDLKATWEAYLVVMVAEEDLHGFLSSALCFFLLGKSGSHKQCADQQQIHRGWNSFIVCHVLIGDTEGYVQVFLFQKQDAQFQISCLCSYFFPTQSILGNCLCPWKALTWSSRFNSIIVSEI